MSYANGTTNYNLPQTVGTDKRDWSDTNQAFYDVDAALKAASDGASQAAEDITALTLRVGTAEDDIAGLKAEDISLDGRLDTAEGAISTLQLQVPDVRSDLEDMIVAFNEASATSTHAYSEGDYFIYNDVLYKATTSIGIGDTIVPNTNCSATNVMTEIENGAAAPTAADVSLAPITGMAADDVQEGISELKTAIDAVSEITSLNSTGVEPETTGTNVTLSEDIDNFTTLIFVTRSLTGSDIRFVTYVPVTVIKNLPATHKIDLNVLHESGNVYGCFALYVNDTTLSITKAANGGYLDAIYGIK